MAVTLTILGSSSSGNAALLTTPRCRVLIDAGFSGRKLGELLEATGTRLEDIDAVFLTHEHNDHCAGVSGLSKLPKLRFFSNHGTAASLKGCLKREVKWQVFETGSTFTFADLEVTSFSIPHDSTEPVGFLFSHGGGDDLFSPSRRLAWVTDLGYVPNLVRERVKAADVLVLEANHDLEMLDRDTKRPHSVKQRIRGRHGHLSNEAAATFVKEATKQDNVRWSEILLAHLSRDCNEVERVEAAFGDPLARPRNTRIRVLDPTAGPMVPITVGGW